MFEKIVLSTDLSSDWDDIVACAEEFKVLGCKEIILTHVLGAKGLDVHDMETFLSPEGQARLEAQKNRLESQGFRVAVETPAGLPALSLNEVTQRHSASLIVMGSHGKSPWREAILGSVSNALLHHARFPILLINVKRLREEALGAICQLRTTELLRHVLFPTDFSEIADEAAKVLESLVSKGLSEVTVLHTLEMVESHPTAVLRPDEGPPRSRLKIEEERFRKAGVPRVNSHFTKGHPISRILEALREGNFSLVVMGAQGKGLVSEIFLGSVAYNIARLAPCPVLLIPRAQEMKKDS
ncbi:MAG: universal stress protein [Deltaproteobacteria bacterium]|nr:universal stress protein [Deltaproteobacteria bacterium]